MSTKDPLESFVRKNRERFNEDRPPTDLWDKIDDRVNNTGKVRSIRPMAILLRVAAVVVVVVGLAVFAYQLDQPSSDPMAANYDTNITLSEVSPEMAEIEYYYVSEIDQLMERLQPDMMDEEVTSALDQLDEEYKRLQKEMGENRNSDEVLEAMIQTYRLKLDILLEVYRTTQKDGGLDKNESDVTSI